MATLHGHINDNARPGHGNNHRNAHGQGNIHGALHVNIHVNMMHGDGNNNGNVHGQSNMGMATIMATCMSTHGKSQVHGNTVARIMNNHGKSHGMQHGNKDSNTMRLLMVFCVRRRLDYAASGTVAADATSTTATQTKKGRPIAGGPAG